MGNWKEVHIACPCGKSSDAFCLRDDGSGYCFSAICTNPNFRNKNMEDFEDLSDEFVHNVYPQRGLSEKTLLTFNVMTKFSKQENDNLLPLSTGFVYPNGAVKIRSLEEKKFISKGDMSNATLFMKNYFDKGSRRCITITEGEYDALTVAQILQNDSAVVSVRSASSAVQDCKKEWEYINSFDKIIVNFDNDEPGQSVAKKVLGLFDFKKTFNLCLDRHKDANSYIWDSKENLPRDEGKLYYDAWKGVRRHTPDNIISGNEEFRKALGKKRTEMLCSYPIEEMQAKLHGIHVGEVIIIKALEKIGKTELFRLFEDHALKTTKHPIGIIHLEEDISTTLTGMAAYYERKAIHIPDSNTSEDEIMEVISKINGKDEGRLFLRSSFDLEDEDAFINGIRFLVSVCGCRLVFLDHISWLATGGSEDTDERKKLDRISQRLKLLAKELEFALIMISHVNDDGKTRGSRYIAKVGDTIININRDKTNPDENERHKTYIEIEGARLMGSSTGPAGYALYDMESRTLIDPRQMSL